MSMFSSPTRPSAPNGAYEITNIPPGVYALVFSMIGYKIKTIQLQIRAIQMPEYKIQLIPEPIKGKEVLVTASVPKEWQKNLQRFTRLFPGESKNAQACKILNPYVPDFTINKETKEFMATSDGILMIENRALGYRLHIWLDCFSYNYHTGQCVYGMNARYQELESKHKKEREKWEKNRRLTYQGSLRHFLSALARQALKREDFCIYEIRALGTGLVDAKIMVLPGAEHQSYADPQISDQESDASDPEFMTRKTEIIAGTPIPIKENAILFSDSSNSIKKLKFETYLGVTFKKLNLTMLRNFIKLNYPFAEIATLGNLLTPYAITE